MYRKSRLIVVAALAVSMAGVALSQPQDRLNQGAKFWERPEVQEKLGLTAEQENELAAHFYEAARSRLARRSQIQILELELDQLMNVETADEEAITAKAREIGELKSQQYQDRIAERMSLKKILTREQQTELRELGRAQRDARRNRSERARRPRTPNLNNELDGGLTL
jgi:Spy/CpxP family protein refolding chaperone